MFIHWGLYSIPAGEWPGKGNGHAEWIRDTAQIPVEEYEKLRDTFNPVKFDADAWVAAAKGAGMKYVCITTKHHDGFCLFDTKQTDWSMMHTPFKRDIMKEIAEASRKQGMVPCWYHSIMDWHHPDYVPRRPWEQASRPTEGADFERFNSYLKSQVGELLTNYGPIGVMWFDGQWEGTWNHTRGQDLYDHCRKLQPNVIVNNRCDRGPNMGSINGPGEAGVRYAGDYLTPEQEIPATGLGTDWETCMTMNNHWGYNAVDHNFKSTEDLIHKLADIASKGGNFLLNVGPTAEGEIPKESLQRLAEIGEWMNVNGEAINGTQAGPFEEQLPWGRCTMKPYNAGIAAGKAGNPLTATRLYLHVFNWPKDGRLVVPGIFNEPRGAFLLASKGQNLTVTRGGDNFDALVIDVPAKAPDAIDSVVVLDLEGSPDVARKPVISAEGDTGGATSDVFVNRVKYAISSPASNVELHFTTDGTVPTMQSTDFARILATVHGMRGEGEAAPTMLQASQTTTISARAFRNGRPVGPVAKRTFTKVSPLPAVATDAKTVGVGYQYFEGDWNRVPNFTSMKPAGVGVVHSFDRQPPARPASRLDKFGFRYHGYLNAPREGVYTFFIASDDGSNLYIDGQRVVNNDGLHSVEEKSGTVALAAGQHAITVDFFEKGGGHELDVWWVGPGMPRKSLKADDLTTE
jgi:alpha-L-fucosidase